MLTNEQVLQKIQGHTEIFASETPFGMLSVQIKREDLIELLRFLRDDEELKISFLTDLCGIHYPEAKGNELGVIYHLHSFSHNYRMRIKCFFPVEDPHIPTATTLYSAANWMERETYDFFGIIFDGHPDLRRILNVDDMDYSPLRKEFPLEDGTRTDKDDRFFGREGNTAITFDRRADHK